MLFEKESLAKKENGGRAEDRKVGRSEDGKCEKIWNFAL